MLLGYITDTLPSSAARYPAEYAGIRGGPANIIYLLETKKTDNLTGVSLVLHV